MKKAGEMKKYPNPGYAEGGPVDYGQKAQDWIGDKLGLAKPSPTPKPQEQPIDQSGSVRLGLLKAEWLKTVIG